MPSPGVNLPGEHDLGMVQVSGGGRSDNEHNGDDLTDKEGIITDTIPAIKADKTLKLKTKNALIALVEELRKS